VAVLKVRIERVTYTNGRDFYILNTRIMGSEPEVTDYTASVTGYLCGLLQVTVGTTIQLHGNWTNHPKYGRQFAISSWLPWATTSEKAAQFLHECVDGFLDHSLVRVITEHFEEDTFDALTNNQQAVMALSVPDEEIMLTKGGVKESTMRRALLAWDRLRAVYELSGLLQDQGITSHAIQAVFSRFGGEARDIVSKNPYRLLELPSFPFSAVDRIAQRMGVDKKDVRRTQGAVLATLRAATLDGNLFVRRGELPLLFADLAYDAKVPAFDTRGSRVEAAVEALAAEGAVKVDPEAGVYLPDPYRYEHESANLLVDFLTPVKLDVDPVSFLLDYEKSHRIDLSDAQREAVEKLLTSRVLVLTGLPGTGKTTVVRAIVNLLRAAGLNYRLMAPTGIAAKRAAFVTSADAATIHRTFGYDGTNWAYNRERKYTVDAVVVDEMSMVDMELFYRILDALHPSTMLILVGDDAQLPSVGPGNVLRELVASKSVSTVRLTQIFRQQEKGGIVVNSHRINRGETLLLDEEKDPTSEFRFVHIEDEEKIANLIVEMATKLKARDANFQVLAPKYDGTVGVDNLNKLLRERLNPLAGQSEWQSKDFLLREGDRVMIVQNDYKKSIYNGDMAKVMSFTRDDVVIKVHGFGANDVDVMVSIPKSEAPYKLKHAYAVTVHKSQGSEWETVILPVTRTQGRMLQRNLFYTAVTRAKSRIWLLGHPDAVSKAIGNDLVIQRNTAFGRAVDAAFLASVGVVGDPVEDIVESESVGVEQVEPDLDANQA
jgi:exodeoxyribonuclease V alpha subunit